MSGVRSIFSGVLFCAAIAGGVWLISALRAAGLVPADPIGRLLFCLVMLNFSQWVVSALTLIVIVRRFGDESWISTRSQASGGRGLPWIGRSHR